MIRWLWVERSFRKYVSDNWTETAAVQWRQEWMEGGLTEWIWPFLEAWEPTPRRSSAVTRQRLRVRVKVYVVPGSQYDRDVEIADAVKVMLEHVTVTVYDHENSGSTALGYLQVYEAETVQMPAPAGPEIAEREVAFAAKVQESVV